MQISLSYSETRDLKTRHKQSRDKRECDRIKASDNDQKKSETWSSKEGDIEIIEEKNGRIKGIFNFSTKKGTQQGEEKK